MSLLDKETIHRKLAVILENLQALQPILQMSREEYIADLYRRKATERLLQELIEAAIDINIHLIVQTGHPAPDDYYESFLKAGEIQVLPTNLAEKIAPSAGLRNRLVHQYDRIDPSIVLQAVRMAEDLYPVYVKHVEEFMSN